MYYLSGLILVSLYSVQITSAQKPKITLSIPVSVVRVIDGDTIDVIAYPWPGVEIRTRVREKGYDAPEISGGCAKAQTLAKKARNVTTEILTRANIIEIKDPEHGAFAGRVVAEIYADGLSLGRQLRDKGYALPYDVDNGRPDWCDILGNKQ